MITTLRRHEFAKSACQGRLPIEWKVASEINLNFLASLTPGSEIDGFRVIDYLHAGGTANLFRVEAARGSDPGFPLVMKVPAKAPLVALYRSTELLSWLLT